MPPADAFAPGDLIVDGLLGIGFTGGVLRQPVASWIRAVNDSGLPVVSLDVPSGLDCDSGFAADAAVCADLTVTFGAVKKGFLCNDGCRLCGVLRAVDIGLREIPGDVRAVTFEEAVRLLPRFASDVHKNRRGELMIAAGSREYCGAASLAASAAVRTGAGIVRLAAVKAGRHLPDSVIVREFPDNENGVLPCDVWLC